MGIKRPPLIVNNPFTRLTDEDEDDDPKKSLYKLLKMMKRMKMKMKVFVPFL